MIKAVEVSSEPILTQISRSVAPVVVVVVSLLGDVMVGMADDQSLLGSTLFGLNAFSGLSSFLSVQSWKYSSLPE